MLFSQISVAQPLRIGRVSSGSQAVLHAPSTRPAQPPSVQRPTPSASATNRIQILLARTSTRRLPPARCGMRSGPATHDVTVLRPGKYGRTAVVSPEQRALLSHFHTRRGLPSPLRASVSAFPFPPIPPRVPADCAATIFCGPACPRPAVCRHLHRARHAEYASRGGRMCLRLCVPC